MIVRTLGMALIIGFMLTGCEQAMHNMYDQPKYLPYEPSSFFSNDMADRPVPPHTVIAREGPLAGTSSGRVGRIPPYQDPRNIVFPRVPGKSTPALNVAQPRGFPPKPQLTMSVLRRGKERFEIYCAPCHSVVGDGKGMIPARGFPNPPSYHTARLRGAADTYFFEVITHGYGMMYSYASRVSPEDRWAIVAYIRALQLSWHTPVSDLSEADRQHLREVDGG